MVDGLTVWHGGSCLRLRLLVLWKAGGHESNLVDVFIQSLVRKSPVSHGCMQF